ncbi:hypothetical protein GIB67_027060, partial [Kingdonia uniflora]
EFDITRISIFLFVTLLRESIFRIAHLRIYLLRARFSTNLQRTHKNLLHLLELVTCRDHKPQPPENRYLKI